MEDLYKSGYYLSLSRAFIIYSNSFLKQLFAYNSEGKSSPSEVVEHSTNPDKPGPPSKPTVKGKIHSHSVKVTWGRLPFVNAVFECCLGMYSHSVTQIQKQGLPLANYLSLQILLLQEKYSALPENSF